MTAPRFQPNSKLFSSQLNLLADEVDRKATTSYVDQKVASATPSGLATVATTGSYTDLLNRPTIPTVPTLATVATTGSYGDLLNKPTLATVAATGSYNDLLNKPATGSGATGAMYDSRDYNILCDSTTDDSLAIQALFDYVDTHGGGYIRMVGADPTKAFYVNSRIQLGSNTVCEWMSPILAGPNGGIAIVGKADEGTARYNIRQASPSGTSTIYCSTTAPGTAASYAVGNVITIRGQTDSAGNSLWSEQAVVSAVDTVANTLTLAAPLEESYQPTYATGKTLNTKIAIVAQTPMATTAAGSTTVSVTTTSGFLVGDVVSIQDNLIGANISGTSSNQLHMEANVILAVDSANNTLTLELPLAHDYSPAYSPKVIRTIPAVNSGHINPRITFAASSTDRNVHACSLIYAVHCFIKGLRVLGDPKTGIGGVGHGIRFADGTLFCVADDVVVSRPAKWASGEGYGATFYAGCRGNRLTNYVAEGCRHSVLLFKGANGNHISNVVSVDNRGTDIDFHGAGERDNYVSNVLIRGGPSTTADITTKAAIKIGNPTHRGGAWSNVITGVQLHQMVGYAVQILAGCDKNIVSGVQGDSTMGVSIEGNPSDTALTTTRSVVSDVVLRGCEPVINIDGGTTNAVIDTLLSRITSIEPPMGVSTIKVRNAQDLKIEQPRVEKASSAGVVDYVVDIRDCSTLRFLDARLDGGRKGIYLANCPNGLIDRPILSGQTGRVVMQDAGGNTNARLQGYYVRDYLAAFSESSPSTGLIRRSREPVNTRVVSAVASATTLTGAGNQVAVTNSAPSATAGQLLATATLQPTVPKGLVGFSATVPYVSIDTTDNAVAFVAWASTGSPTVAAVVDMRITAGASTGNTMVVTGAFRHDLLDLTTALTVTLRIGIRTASTTLTLGNQFGSTLDKAVLVVSELLE